MCLGQVAQHQVLLKIQKN